MSVQTIALAHEPDVAWIIALWIAIHGGDPGPEGRVRVDETTALLAATLSARLAEVHHLGPLTSHMLQERLGRATITMHGHGTDHPHSVNQPLASTVCIDVFRDTDEPAPNGGDPDLNPETYCFTLQNVH